MCFLTLSLPVSREPPDERTILLLHRPYALVTPSNLSAAPKSAERTILLLLHRPYSLATPSDPSAEISSRPTACLSHVPNKSKRKASNVLPFQSQRCLTPFSFLITSHACAILSLLIPKFRNVITIFLELYHFF